MNKMNLNEINEAIEKLDNWEVVDSGKAIEREFTLNNFQEALDFVNSVGKIAESENHHPDILIFSYKKVKITLSTHEVDGLSEKDFLVASKVDEL